MKKLLLTVVALAFASTAMASSMNLGWQACRTAVNNANAAVNDVAVANFDCNNVLSVRNLIASVVGAPAYTTHVGASIQLDLITSGGAALPNWWDVGQKIADPNNCRAGSLLRSAVATHNSCANPYGAAQQGGENFSVGLLGAGTVRFDGDHVTVGGNPFVAPSTGGYAAMLVVINNANAIDPDFGDVFCAGCATPACLVLNRVDWATDLGKEVISTTELRSFVTWYGGTGANCPGATPTKNSTWGQVKALYR